MQRDPEVPEDDEDLEVAGGGVVGDGVVIMNEDGGPMTPGIVPGEGN